MWILSNIFSGAAVVLGVAHYLQSVLRGVNPKWIAVLFNYSLANASAFRLDIQRRAYPRVITILGLLLCLFLMRFIQAKSLAAGVICLLLGVLCHFVGKR